MPFQVLVGLIFCNIVWAANPIMSKLLLATFTPAQVAWIRYSSATGFFLAFLAALKLAELGRVPLLPKRHGRPGAPRFFAKFRSWREFLLVLGVGFSAFCFAPLVGLSGLNRTGAIDNALLIAMEPLVTVSLAVAFLRERLSRVQLLSFVFAILGFGLLSGLLLTPASEWMSEPSIVGNLILVLSLVGEAGYSIFARQLAGRFAMTEVFGSSLLLGFAVLWFGIAPFSGLPSWDALMQLDSRGWLAILWLGPLGSTLTYLYWLVALERTAVSSAALTLFIQPIVGALLGALALGEQMTAMKWAGGALILFAVGLLTLRRQNS
jgi:drug/metabolite transporter (DMT)-like permease